MLPAGPPYISPKERAENRARIVSFALWGSAAVALFVAAMLFAYTDQAPRWMRNAAFQIDGAFGFPVLALIRALAG